MPLIGSLFRPKTYSSSKRELIVFLRPYIVSEKSEEEMLGTRAESLTREEARYFIETGRFPQLENPKYTEEKMRESEAQNEEGASE